MKPRNGNSQLKSAKVVKELHCKKYQSGKSHAAAKGVKSVRFRDNIESVLNDTLIAGIDGIKEKEKKDSANSDSEKDGTRSNLVGSEEQRPQKLEISQRIVDRVVVKLEF